MRPTEGSALENQVIVDRLWAGWRDWAGTNSAAFPAPESSRVT